MSTISVTSPQRTREQVSDVMRAVASTSTEPERLLRKALRRNGLRSFRICAEELPGKPDIIVPSRKLAVFIDGDFWHGNQYKLRGQLTLEQQFKNVNNSAYWNRKIGSNIARDLNVTGKLLSLGWKVVRFWESDIRESVEHCVKIILSKNAEAHAAFSALPRKTAAERFLPMTTMLKKSRCIVRTSGLVVLTPEMLRELKVPISQGLQSQPPHFHAMISL
jgi:DNA mismatch endonuclease (patch repair protein)